MIEFTQSDINRFYKKIIVVDSNNESNCCWEIDLYHNKDGYAHFSIKDDNIRAHRFMYMIHHQDENIDDLEICHTCDNPGCVNPNHLWSGTHKDNMNDRDSKNRCPKGSTNGCSKLTEEDIEEILVNTISGYFVHVNEICNYYNVQTDAIYNILNQKYWTHITKDYDMKKIKKILYVQGGTRNRRSRLNDNEIRDIKIRLKNNESQYSIANIYDIAHQTVNRIANNIIHKDIT